MTKFLHHETVNWTMTDPPLGDSRSSGDGFVWREAPDECQQPGDDVLEASLRLSSGTLAYLRAAFSARLDRKTRWQCPASPTDASPCHMAAGLFRRGVDCGQEVRSSSGSYAIDFVDPSEPLGELIKPLARDRAFTVVDRQVASAWQEVGSGSLTIALDERAKTLSSVSTIVEAWREAGAPRRPWVIIGGGIVGDVAAFAAALMQCSFVLLPTTTLAIADACVGGKTGVNFPPFGKNQLGRFAFPERVVVWPKFLDTLPDDHFRAGGAECFKHAFLSGDKDLAQKLVGPLSRCDAAALAPLLPGIVRTKVDVVQRDATERGERAILNFGHTLAHAFEAMSHNRGTPLLHGQAVAIGMKFALGLSVEFADLSPQVANEMVGLLTDSGVLNGTTDLRTRLGLVVGQGGDDSDSAKASAEGVTELETLLLQDKKGDSGDSRWVLLRDWGQVARDGEQWTVPVPLHAVRSRLERARWI